MRIFAGCIPRALALVSPLLLLAGCMARSAPDRPRGGHRTESAWTGGDGARSARQPQRRLVVVTRKRIVHPIGALERRQIIEAQALARLTSVAPEAPPPAPPARRTAPTRAGGGRHPGTAAPTAPPPAEHRTGLRPLRCRRICRHVLAICYATRRICDIAGRLGSAQAVAACRRGRGRCQSARRVAHRHCGGCQSASRHGPTSAVRRCGL